MLAGIVLKLCRRDSFGANVARRPDTIASTLMQICGSHMLVEFGGLEELKDRERDKLVRRWGKRYAIGDLVGLDGVARVGVDEDIFFGRDSGAL